MSRAFVKEPDGDQALEDLPEIPQSPHPNYVTPTGFEALERRLAALAEERTRLRGSPARIGQKLSLAELDRQIRFVEGRLERAIVTDPARQPRDRVCFGAWVRAMSAEGETLEWSIVGEDEAEVEAGRISWVSPAARALLGASVGDVVTWERPVGDTELEILSIDYRGA